MNKATNSVHILRVINLNVETKAKKTILKNINFQCLRSEFFVILGKNGHGKTTLSLSIANLLNKNVFNVKGEIFFDKINILKLNKNELISLRQKKIGYILQNPFASFNPIKTIKAQFEEQSELKKIPFETFITLMKELSLNDYDLILKKFPFELSGGILQRLSVVRCLASNPELIIADEPTSALDKPITDHLLNLIFNHVREKKSTLILITQDISIAEKYADTIAFLDHGELKLITNKDGFFQTKENVDLRILLEAYSFLKYE